MTAPDKPGLSNEEFIPFSRGMVGEAIHACPPNKELEEMNAEVQDALNGRKAD